MAMAIDIIIDSLTNCLVRTETGEECDTEYRLVARTIIKVIRATAATPIPT